MAAILVLSLLLVANATAAGAGEKLSARYKKWLEEVVFIITKEERDAFLHLTGDEDRDKFIDRFWEVRNPTPGSPTNSYKEGHYQRIAYASQHFGAGSPGAGWHTDRGRVYITLGTPQQRAYHLNLQNLRPMEIWFYSNSHPALPPFFYVVFYQRDAASEFRLYSPYMDGPEKLVTTGRAINDRKLAMRYIQESAGREVARISLSLLPDEPVDMDNAQASLESDLMLATIRNLANHPLNKLELERHRSLLENVTTRLILGGDLLRVLATSLRDPEGNTNLHYVLRLQKPEDFTLGQSKENRYYYSINVSAKVSDAGGKLIYSQEKTLSRDVDKNRFDQIKNSVFGYEGWLPLPPGKYKVEFLLTNLLKHTAFRGEKSVTVAEPPTEGVRLPDLVAFSDAEAVDPAVSGLLPFSSAGVKFTPLMTSELNLLPGQDLRIFYQVWTPGQDPRSLQGKKLQVEYAYGRPGGRGEWQVIREEVGREQFDAKGSLLTGVKIPLAGLHGGNYMVTVSLNDPETNQKAYGTLGFRVLGTAVNAPVWDVFDDLIGQELHSGIVNYERGLCYLSQEKKDLAIEWFRRALQKNPEQEEARSRLVDLYFAQGNFSLVADLANHGRITKRTDEKTILRMAESFDKAGDPRRAMGLLESALEVRTDNGPLYLALAAYYHRSGDVAKAAELERKGKSLLSSAPVQP